MYFRVLSTPIFFQSFLSYFYLCIIIYKFSKIILSKNDFGLWNYITFNNPERTGQKYLEREIWNGLMNK